MQLSPAAQTFPQLPQLFGSLVVLRQPLGQQLVPPVHGGPPLQLVGVLHVPATHVSPAAQGLPQLPQFFTSVDVSVQPVAQQVSLPVQTGPPLQLGGVTHMPAAHVAPVGQTWLQPPQLFGSVSMSLHPDAQHWSTPVQTGPPLHDVGAWQFPFWHVAPGGHAKPHWLQLFGSVFVSVQPDSQHVWSPVQAGPPLHELDAHKPPWQVAPSGQRFSQPPQLFGSVCVSVQPDGQQVCSGPHVMPPVHTGGVGTQLPSTQPSLKAQPLPQLPQLPGSVWVSVQPLAQHCSMPVQTGPPLHVLPPTHAPETQASSAPHTFVQLPQCSGETCSLTQVSPQQLSPTEQPTSAHPWGG